MTQIHGDAATRPNSSPKTSIQFAMHTILWGRAPENMTEILHFIRDAGFVGVEFFQHPTYLRSQFGTARELKNYLEELGLSFVGLCSGTLEERVGFCREGDLQPVFLYVDGNDRFIEQAQQLGFTIAFHPHAYKQVDPDEVFQKVLTSPGMKLLLDPAHLTVMNRDPVSWLSRAIESKDQDGSAKLIAVHLKDWGTWYGRSFQRYAQGFTELGEGDVRLVDFIRRLSESKLSLWAVVEQDHMTATADHCVQTAVKWIQQNVHGCQLHAAEANNAMVATGLPATIDLSKAGERVLNGILRAQETPEVFANFVVDLFQDWLHCKVVSLWEHTPAMSQLTVISTYPRGVPVPPMSVDKSLPGYVVESKAPWFLKDINSLPDRPFSRQDVAIAHGLKSLYSVPIWNSHNPNDIEGVLNLYFASERLEECFPEDVLDPNRMAPGTSVREHIDRIMTTAGEYLAMAFERILADRVVKAVTEVRKRSGLPLLRKDFLSECLHIACKAVGAVGATIFLESSQQRCLRVAATTGISWKVKKHYYGLAEGQVGRCWERDLEIVSAKVDKSRLLSEETLDPAAEGDTCIVYIPIRDGDGCIGVLRCRNKTREPRAAIRRFFTQSDITVLQAICDAIIPRLKLFSAEERNVVMFRKMAHELKTPLTGINSQLDYIEHESRTVKFSQGWIKEARDNTSLMARLINNTEILARNLDAEFAPEPFVKKKLLADVVYPVRDQMYSFLSRKNLDRTCIQVFSEEEIGWANFQKVDVVQKSSWIKIPPLFIQISAIQQVFFNLFANAIKYGWKSPTDFRIRVAASEDASSYIIAVRDWGIGVEESEKDEIFELGKRGKMANRYDVYGHGYGLAICREIMQAHHGDVRLTRLKQYTEFSIYFPKWLAERPAQ